VNYLGPNDIKKIVDYTNDFQLYINLNPKIFASNGKTQTCNEVEIIRHGWLEYIYNFGSSLVSLHQSKFK